MTIDRGTDMNLQTFKAPTMAEALAQVKATMGASAVILHTRTYSRSVWLGLRRREEVEITAGRGLNVGPRRVVAQPQPPRPVPLLARQYGGYPAAAAPVSVGAYPGRALLETPAANNAVMMGLTQEMYSLKTMVK